MDPLVETGTSRPVMRYLVYDTMSEPRYTPEIGVRRVTKGLGTSA
jgi:hypothetical protein